MLIKRLRIFQGGLNNIQEQRTKIKIRREGLALDFEKTILNIAGSE